MPETINSKAQAHSVVVEALPKAAAPRASALRAYFRTNRRWRPQRSDGEYCVREKTSRDSLAPAAFFVE